MKKTIKTILITGSRLRIGAGIAQYFTEIGWHVIIHGRAENCPSAFANKKNISYLRADLTNTKEATSLVRQAYKINGRLDCLINNASTYSRSRLETVSEIELSESYKINFLAPLLLMQEYKKITKSGSIINILDQKIYGNSDGCAAYLLAKKSLYDATIMAAMEWGPNYRVNAVAPGIVLPPPGITSTAGLKRMAKLSPLQKVIPIQDIAESCKFLAENQSISGQVIYVDGGMHLTNINTGEPNNNKIYK